LCPLAETRRARRRQRPQGQHGSAQPPLPPNSRSPGPAHRLSAAVSRARRCRPRRIARRRVGGSGRSPRGTAQLNLRAPPPPALPARPAKATPRRRVSGPSKALSRSCVEVFAPAEVTRGDRAAIAWRARWKEGRRAAKPSGRHRSQPARPPPPSRPTAADHARGGAGSRPAMQPSAIARRARGRPMAAARLSFRAPPPRSLSLRRPPHEPFGSRDLFRPRTPPGNVCIQHQSTRCARMYQLSVAGARARAAGQNANLTWLEPQNFGLCWRGLRRTRVRRWWFRGKRLPGLWNRTWIWRRWLRLGRLLGRDGRRIGCPWNPTVRRSHIQDDPTF
jgi:hypothetical protein